MKKLLVIMILSLFNMQINAFASIKVPENTEITLIPAESVISKNASSRIKLKIKDDVIIDNNLIFRKGDKAFLEIADSAPADFFGKPGYIEIFNGYVYDVRGQTHEVLIDKKIEGKERGWVLVLFSLGFTVILFPFFLFAFVKGTNADISPAKELEVMLKEEFVF